MITSSDQIVPVIVIDELAKTVLIKDITDYAGLSQALTGIHAVGTLTGPLSLGIIDKQTYADPIIDLEGGTTGVAFNLPVDGNQKIVFGDYVLSYTIRNEDGTFSFTKEVTICYTEKDILNVSNAYNCETTSFKFVDDTNYNGLTITSKNLTIKHPINSQGDRVANDYQNTALNQSSVIVLSSLWTGTYTTIFGVAGTYLVGANLEIAFSRTSNSSLTVECQSSLVGLLNCISKVAETYKAMCETGAPTRSIECDLMLLNTYMGMYEVSSNQGVQNNQAENLAKKIFAIVDKYGCGCGQNSSEPVLIGESTSENSVVPDPRGFNSLIKYDRSAGAEFYNAEYKVVFDSSVLKVNDLVRIEFYYVCSSDDQEIIAGVESNNIQFFIANPSSGLVVLYIEKTSNTNLSMSMQNREGGALVSQNLTITETDEENLVTVSFESAEPFGSGEGVYSVLSEYKIK